MSDEKLPPCGLYRTTREVAGIPADRLVYFHNHGDPGPGLYLPTSWKGNRVEWQPRGHTLESPETDASTLEALAAQGFYRVVESFHCCDKECRLFEPDTLVQLGYNGAAEPLLFVPLLEESALSIPERGTRIDRDRIARLRALKVAVKRDAKGSAPPGEMLH